MAQAATDTAPTARGVALARKAKFELPDMLDPGWISSRVRRRRTELGFSQADAVEAIRGTSGLEMSVSTYSRCETGKMELSNGGAYILAIARGLGCTVTYLLGLTDNPRSWTPSVDWTAEDEVRAFVLDAEARR